MMDLIFQCKKCLHQVYTDDARKMLTSDCPNCGEEPYENWILFGEGNYEDHNGPKLN